LQWQRFSSRNLGQRKTGNFSGGKRQILCREREIFFFLTVEGGDSARIEGCQATTREVILNLVFDGSKSRSCGFS